MGRFLPGRVSYVSSDSLGSRIGILTLLLQIYKTFLRYCEFSVETRMIELYLPTEIYFCFMIVDKFLRVNVRWSNFERRIIVFNNPYGSGFCFGYQVNNSFTNIIRPAVKLYICIRNYWYVRTHQVYFLYIYFSKGFIRAFCQF